MGKAFSKGGVSDFCKKLCGVYRWKNYASGNRTDLAERKATDNSTLTKEKILSTVIDDVDEFVDEEYFTKEDLKFYSKKYAQEEIVSSYIPAEMRYTTNQISERASIRGGLVWNCLSRTKFR